MQPCVYGEEVTNSGKCRASLREFSGGVFWSRKRRCTKQMESLKLRGSADISTLRTLTYFRLIAVILTMFQRVGRVLLQADFIHLNNRFIQIIFIKQPGFTNIFSIHQHLAPYRTLATIQSGGVYERLLLVPWNNIPTSSLVKWARHSSEREQLRKRDIKSARQAFLTQLQRFHLVCFFFCTSVYVLKCWSVSEDISSLQCPRPVHVDTIDR